MKKPGLFFALPYGMEPHLMMYALLCTQFEYFNIAEKAACAIALCLMYRKKTAVK